MANRITNIYYYIWAFETSSSLIGLWMVSGGDSNNETIIGGESGISMFVVVKLPCVFNLFAYRNILVILDYSIVQHHIAIIDNNATIFEFSTYKKVFKLKE